MLCLVLALAGCTGFKRVYREMSPPESFRQMSQDQVGALRKSSPFLKAHMQDGSVYVLQSWDMSRDHVQLTGTGTLFSAERDTLQHGQLHVDVDSVALFETNVLKTSGTIVPLTVFTAITAAIAVACITNPKACFGSCPTFYASDGTGPRLQAEGFSASISPALEETDVDALFHATAVEGQVDIEMKNEALETHVVRHVNLLAAPRAPGSRVFADLEGGFWESPSLAAPTSAIGPEGSCLPLFRDADGAERYSAADSAYLGAKEIIELTFDDVPLQTSGLVIGCRQTLLSTYLLYQTLAYMGRDAGYWLSRIGRSSHRGGQTGMRAIMGGIEVLVQDSRGNWTVVDQITEHGPLATDFHVVPLGRVGEPLHVRLRMTKGNWRIDYVALAALSGPVQAVRLQPAEVLRDGVADDQARALLCDASEAITTLPGDTYTLRYRMPAGSADHELFLESRGYYLEWIREEWIKEENPFLLAEVLADPKAALMRLTSPFKTVEAGMEECFWRSRYAKP
jgi:hypothetical protein